MAAPKDADKGKFNLKGAEPELTPEEEVAVTAPNISGDGPNMSKTIPSEGAGSEEHADTVHDPKALQEVAEEPGPVKDEEDGEEE